METMSEQQRGYIDEMGTFVERYGGQRTAGRVIAALLISAEPLTQEDLMRLLGLSRTSASVALRWLQQLGYVREVGTPAGERKRCYQIRPDISDWSMHESYRHIRDELRMSRLAEAAAAPEARPLVSQMRRMMTFLNERMEAAIEDWHRLEREGADPRARANFALTPEDEGPPEALRPPERG